MTSKKISQRLKEVGFEANKSGTWIYDGIEGIPDSMDWELDYEIRIWSKVMLPIPAYDAETLFKWLRENVGKVKKYPYSYSFDDEDGFTVDHLIYGDSNDPNNNYDSPAFPFKTSLADMLGEAIIWIKEQQ